MSKKIDKLLKEVEDLAEEYRAKVASGELEDVPIEIKKPQYVDEIGLTLHKS